MHKRHSAKRNRLAGRVPAEWILMALRSLTLGKPPALFTARDEPGKSKPLCPRPKTIEEPPGFGKHLGHSTELCLALSGEAVLTIQSRIYAFTPPGLAIIDPGVLHSEARLARTRSYALLWMVPAKSFLHLHVSRFEAGRRWDIPWRHTFHGASVIPLTKAMDSQRIDPGGRQEPVRAGLLMLLAELYRGLLLENAADHESNQKAAMLNHVKDYLDSNLDRPVSLKQVAAMIKLSPNYLNALFHEWQGQAIHAYLIERRMEKAMHLCRQSTLAVKEIAAAVGFADALYFSRAFHHYHGIWPSSTRGGRKKR